MAPMGTTERVTVEFADCPLWQTATLVVRDEAGNLVGYGWLKRTGERSAELQVTSCPSGVVLLCASPQSVGG